MVSRGDLERPRILKRESSNFCSWFKIIRKTVVFPQSSKPELFYSIKPEDYVTVLAQTAKKEVVLVKQYRPLVEDYTYEFPSGHIEKEELPVISARRELKEEAGCLVKKLIFLGKLIPDTGRIENYLWAFYAGNVTVKSLNGFKDRQICEVCLMPIKRFGYMIRNGSFNHALDLSVVALAAARKLITIRGL